MTHYIPENNYLSTNYAPIKGFTEDLCTRCERYYKNLHDSGLTKNPFPPNCEKHIQNRILNIKKTDFETIQDYQEAVILMDPITWAQSEFGWEARFYQTDMLSCTSQYKMYRIGRRAGKTEALVVETLHHLITHRDQTVLIIAPYERQVTRFFDEMEKFIKVGVTVKGSMSRYTRTPSRMEFHNGSKILGFSSGANSSSGSDKIRGHDANLIVIDEMDTLEDKDIDTVMAILASHKDCKLIAATTPRGWRRRFYTYCTDKDLRFKEFWFISAESPEWDEQKEDFFKRSTDKTTYTHEYLADFAELEEGVFKAKHINASLSNYDMADCEPQPNADYVLGVDWNKAAGTHMAIVENFNGKLKLVKKIIVEESQYTQTEAVQLIISLNRKWRFKYIFADAGYGSVQIELLKKHSLVEASSLFDQKLFGVAMNQHLDVIDPLSGEPVKRNAKHFLIEQTRKLMEDGFLVLPKSEDTSISTNNQQMGLVQQMRNFRIEAVSVYGLPRYSQGQDHTLTAFYLACGGFYWKEGDLKGVPYLRTIRGIEVSDQVNEAMHPSLIEIQKGINSGLKLTRSSTKARHNKPPGSRDLDVGHGRGRGLSNLKRNVEERYNSLMPKKSRGDIGRKKF